LCHNQKERVNDQATSTEGGAAPAARKGDGDPKEMTGNEYQRLAARTINESLTTIEQELHAMHGMSAEVGELHSLYQKAYQGHTMNEEHAKKEVGDILWMIAEYCTANGWNLDDIMWLNIDKLRLRYPEGFDAEHSLHRKAGDI
jgi:NTP pyrophosphatase (non-canonical NTP hydrolase)